MCLNKRVVVGLVLAGLAILVFARDSVGAVIPLLLLAACPLSMLVMMVVMSRGDRHSSGPESRSDVTAEVEELRADVARLRAEQSLDGNAHPIHPSR